MAKNKLKFSNRKTTKNIANDIIKKVGVDNMTQVYQREPTLTAAQQTQWQFGDWLSLRDLSIQDIEESEAKIQLALIVAVSHLQLGDKIAAQRYLHQARKWGGSLELCARVLASGAYNSLGRASLINRDSKGASEHFDHSVNLGTPGIDARLITPIRMLHQAMQLGMAPEQIKDWHLLLTQSQSSEQLTRQEAVLPGSLRQQLMAKLNQLVNMLLSEGQGMMLDGVPVFEQQDPFLPGKLALALSYCATEYSPNDSRTQVSCEAFRHIGEWTKGIKVQSWGIDFYLRALWALQQAGLLHKCVNAEALTNLKQQLNWRSFVNPETYDLKNKPSNFYGVAYSIAYHRYQLGWEGPKHADALLEKIIDHYQATASEFGFADETQGKGRFDRYSFLLIAEISHRFREAGLPLPKRMKGWLKNSADYVLVNLNKQGDGFQYGRSIGAYGDTAFIEILSAAAWFKVLTEQEQQMAYHFSCLCTQKFLNYWWDDKRTSVNLWEDGRSTDAYRGKHRILGENFSLIHQHLYTQQIWEELGFIPDYIDNNEYCEYLYNLPKATLTSFNKDLNGGDQKAIFTWRDKGLIFNVPLVNGEEYYEQSPYLPTPYSSAGINGIPDTAFPLLVPKIKLKTGESVIPVSFYQNVTLDHNKEKTILSWDQFELILCDNKKPVKYSGLSIKTVFEFKSGRIERRDKISGEQLNNIEFVTLEWLKSPEIREITKNNNEAVFESDFLKKISFIGYANVNSSLSACYESASDSSMPNELELGWFLDIQI